MITKRPPLQILLSWVFLCSAVACSSNPSAATQESPTLTQFQFSYTPSPTSTATNIPTSTIPILLSGRIAFTSQRIEGMPEIYVMNADGSVQTRLTDDLLNNHNLIWSPNGQMLAFETFFVQGDEVPTLVRLINLDGSGLINMTPEFGHFNSPSWSPDSMSLVLASEDGDIFSVQIDGTRLTNLTNTAAQEIDPHWSPDGSRIAFVSNLDGSYNIYTMSPNGTNRVRLTDFQGEETYRIFWSPNGDRLAVIVLQENYHSELYVMNSNGSDFSLLAGSSSYNSEPSWSPDSNRLAFVSGSTDNLNIYVINVDGSEATKLTNSSWNSAPAWSPDGTRIAFTSDRTGNFEIYIMNSDGSQQTQLTSDPQLDVEPVWQP